MDNPEEYLDQAQIELEKIAPEVEHLTGVDRRAFVWRSLVGAAASTFAAKAVHAQTGILNPIVNHLGDAANLHYAVGELLQQPQTPAPFPLGNGEAPAEQFMPYPGGTGALLEKMYKERGVAAFNRATFNVPKWTGPVPTSDEDIAFLPAYRLSALIKEKKITSVRLTKIYLDRLKKYNPVLLCAVNIMEAQGMAEAQRADEEIAAGRYRGPLHGLPYGVKDLFDTKGVPTTWGAKDFETRIIDNDAEIVMRLRNAGAVLIAKLSTGLFAQNDQWFGGRTNNPWNLSQGASGSSAGPASATAAACVAFGIGTETSGSIVSPTVRCGLSALRPTFGRVSRAGGMVLSWSMDRVGPMTRTVMDSAMVFNAVHGADEKDPSTITVPFQFDPNIKLAGLRIGVDPGRAPDAGGPPQGGAPAEFVAKLTELGMKPLTIGPRPTVAGMGGGGLNAVYAAAFDSYVQRKAKETGLDLNNLPEPAAGRGGGGGAGRGAGAAGATAGGAPTTPPNPMAPADWNPRFVGGRTVRAFDFINSQRRRYVLISEWGVFMKDLDMFIASPSGDVGQNAQTGHPCAVVQSKFEVPAQGGRGGGGGGGGGAGAPAAAPVLNPQPICATIIGALYNDDKILSVAHQYQTHTDIRKHRPKIA
ncbi:MAG: amidase [Phycisphaerae bacterium]|nr:amidase [Gemmatimonadaceae bacterium]